MLLQVQRTAARFVTNCRSFQLPLNNFGGNPWKAGEKKSGGAYCMRYIAKMAEGAFIPVVSGRDVEYYLRDVDSALVTAWKEKFKEHENMIKVSKGDIFNGAPAVDAVVSPTNGFGFMNGGIDGACRRHFGQQLQNRLRNVILTKFDGEIHVGQAVIIPTYEQERAERTIKFLISSPTMRVPTDISETVNVYICFRAILLAVHHHNLTQGNKLIKRVLVPGLGTGTGKMPKVRSAHQMLQAYETFVSEIHPSRLAPESLEASVQDHTDMCKYGGKNVK